ncbi:MAG: hypothetical protein KDB79_14300 [Acidobacteria bacterium]|nr:hypothetical protein [Acidobacteriota bacterium]
MNEKKIGIITSALIGISAYMCADISHEVIGHGGAAVISGNHIDLLTSVFFKSSPGGIMTDLAGPLSNLFFGLLIYSILKFRSKNSFPLSLWLITVMAYNFFWFSGTVLQSGFSQTGDWTYTISQLNIGALAKPLLIISGIIAYLISFKFVADRFSALRFGLPEISLKQSIFYSYLFAIIAAIIAGLFYAPDRTSAAKEGLLEMLASLPILLVGKNESDRRITIETDWIFYFSIFVSYILFCLTLGIGIY